MSNLQVPAGWYLEPMEVEVGQHLSTVRISTRVFDVLNKPYTHAVKCALRSEIGEIGVFGFGFSAKEAEDNAILRALETLEEKK